MMHDHLSTRPTPLAELGPVLGELVHDLANEIQVLHGWALLARGEVAAGRIPTSELDHVLTLSTDLGRMLRDVTETVAGLSLSPEVTFDPQELTESLLNERSREIVGLELRMSSHLPREVRVRGRASFWTRSLANLVGNATRHARRVVSVRLDREEEDGRAWVVAQVEDDGPGIPEEDRAHIFQPLWRGSRGQTGLGLSATNWLAAELHGSLRYREGSALGGATFELRVPVSTRLVGGGSADAARIDGDALNGIRLLLIDDDPGVRVALARLLRRVGAEIRDLDPRDKSLDRIADRVLGAQPDFIMIDLRLGARDGIDLWRELSARVPAITHRVLFISGAMPGDPQWVAAVATGQPVLAKPFDLERLIELLKRLRTSE